MIKILMEYSGTIWLFVTFTTDILTYWVVTFQCLVPPMDSPLVMLFF